VRNNNTSMQELERLIRNWERYRELVVTALGSPETSARHEKSFLGLKAELAAQIQRLGDMLPRSMAYESSQSVEVMADLMKRHVTLCTYDMGEQWELQDFENTWHQYFIFLNRLRGTDLHSGNPDAIPVENSRKGGLRSGPTFTAPDSLQQALSNAGGALALLWAGPGHLFEPLAASSGAPWGLGLAVVLALLSGAFFVARGQN